MMSLTDLLHQSTAHAWLFVPSAILLGALHGLEPGHSKTMMAAFIIAIRGTVAQAVLLGLAAAMSHTAVVWVVALGGQYAGRDFDTDATEPYFQLASAIIILVVAVWMIWRTLRDQQRETVGQDHSHAGHYHGENIRRIDTGHGVMALEVCEDGGPPRFRIRFDHVRGWRADDVSVTTKRFDGVSQTFSFQDRAGYLESVQSIPEPHDFMARISLGHSGHSHHYDVPFAEHDHGPEHRRDALLGVRPLQENVSTENVSTETAFMDVHARGHASDIEKRFAGTRVTTWQIVMFGVTSGLIPCPAAITVLLLCLQLKQISLGAMLVLCFSIGLAVTMVTAGVVASISVRHLATHWPGFNTFARRAPYASGALMLVIAAYMAISGWVGLTGTWLPS